MTGEELRQIIFQKEEAEMFPAKKILCPTDFSEPSLKGVQAAAEFAERYSREVILLHVIPPAHNLTPPTIPSGKVLEYYDELTRFAQKSLDELIEEKFPKSLSVSSRVVQGNPSDEIVRTASEEKVNLIVIATHGATGWRRFMFGSVAEKVVRMAGCPVLTIPAPEKEYGSDG
jgi:nucleotide-binding universal stress UspA family protein